MVNTQDYIELLDQMKSVALAKNSDYAGDEDFLANFKLAEMLGVRPVQGVAIRLTDKFSRVCQLLQKDEPAVKDEKLEDTLLDMANYAILAILCLMDEQEQLTEVTGTEKEVAGWTNRTEE
jgi:hypothetical protein